MLFRMSDYLGQPSIVYVDLGYAFRKGLNFSRRISAMNEMELQKCSSVNSYLKFVFLFIFNGFKFSIHFFIKNDGALMIQQTSWILQQFSIPCPYIFDFSAGPLIPNLGPSISGQAFMTHARPASTARFPASSSTTPT